ASPQLREWRRLHHGIGPLRRARRSVIDLSSAADAGFSATLAGGWGRGRVGAGGRRGDVLGHALPKHGDAAHADVGRSSGARSVGVRYRGELEGGDLPLALAPAGDLVGLLSMQHVASLVPASRVTRQDIDAIDRGYRQEPLVKRVAYLDRIAS